MEVRTAQRGDIEAVAALWARAGVAGSEEEAAAEVAERLQRDEDLFVVGVEDGRIVASVMGCYDGHRGWLKRVAVEPSRQGRGIGRVLVDEAERRFAARGVTKLRLAVWGENAPALAFWREMGYELQAQVRYHAKDLDGGPGDCC